jgi:hypothetical protein
MKKQLLLTAGALFAAAQAQAGAPQIKHVFVIALENHNFTQPGSYTATGQLYGNPAAPFINSLVTPGNANAAQVSYASHYNNVIYNGSTVHPSEPNYVWAEAGKPGPLNDQDPYPNNIVGGPSLSALIAASGQTWKSYQEDIDLAKNGTGGLTNTVLNQNQWTVPLTSFSGTSADYTNAYNGSHQYNYAAKHNPQVFFTATNGGNDSSPSNPQAHNYAPLQQLHADLAGNTVADYNWITPDQYNDMHSALKAGFDYHGVHYTGDQAEIAQGDNFLSQVVPMIMASQAYQDNGAIIIWNDEDEGDNAGTDSLFSGAEIVISPLAKGNAYNSTISLNHSSDLLTMQEIFGLTGTHLGDAANATDLSDLFKPGAIGGVPEPASWAMMLGGFGLVGGTMRRRRLAIRFA